MRDEGMIKNSKRKKWNKSPAVCIIIWSWWRHQMVIFSALLAIGAGNSSVPGEFSAQRPVTRTFDVSFDLRLNKRLRKQSLGWWFETLSRPLWRQCNGVMYDNPLELCVHYVATCMADWVCVRYISSRTPLASLWSHIGRKLLQCPLMASWHGSDFRITGPSCGESQKVDNAELWFRYCWVVSLNKLLNRRWCYQWVKTSWRPCVVTIMYRSKFSDLTLFICSSRSKSHEIFTRFCGIIFLKIVAWVSSGWMRSIHPCSSGMIQQQMGIFKFWLNFGRIYSNIF